MDKGSASTMNREGMTRYARAKRFGIVSVARLSPFNTNDRTGAAACGLNREDKS